MKVLIVDDSKVITKRHKKTIEDLYPNSEITVYTDPTEAIEDLQTKSIKFEFAFLDYNMPEIDGVTLAQMIIEKSYLESFNFIGIVSANIQKAVEDKAASLGITFFGKPLEEDKLKKFVDQRKEL